jgi:demethylmenaquinone methyltransferase/2-methoxy-6-polyprenyl-1,4-benzoquinol methylase
MTDTPPLDEELQATRSFYDRISRAYDLISDAGEHRARETGLDLLAAAPGESVLEIGFGTGHGLLALAAAVGGQGRVAGIDISEGMARVARQRLEKEGLEERVELQVAAVPPLPFGDRSFDAVTMSFTLELFSPEIIPRLLAEIRRVLREGGRLGVVCMATPARGRESLLERAYQWMHRHFPHIVDCRPIDVEPLLGEAGFQVTDRVSMEIWTLPVAAVVSR